MSITIARDMATLQKEWSKQRFDAVVVESRNGHDTTWFSEHIDPSHTVLIQGSRDLLKRTLKLVHPSHPQNGAHHDKSRDVSLESYLEVKTGEFVRGMRNGSAKNLHPILIAAVERPLIASALRETGGNQLRAAELLGLNRNTLRKKIVDLCIPLKPEKTKVARSAS